MLMMMVVVMMAGRTVVTRTRVTSADGVLPRWSAHIGGTTSFRSGSKEVANARRSSSCHRKVSSPCAGSPLSCPWMSISACAWRGWSFERTRSSGWGTHRKVVVRLQRHDPVLDAAHAVHRAALIVDYDVGVTADVRRRGRGVRDDAHRAPRVRRAHCARVRVLLVYRQG